MLTNRSPSMPGMMSGPASVCSGVEACTSSMGLGAGGVKKCRPAHAFSLALQPGSAIQLLFLSGAACACTCLGCAFHMSGEASRGCLVCKAPDGCFASALLCSTFPAARLMLKPHTSATYRWHSSALMWDASCTQPASHLPRHRMCCGQAAPQRVTLKCTPWAPGAEGWQSCVV